MRARPRAGSCFRGFRLQSLLGLRLELLSGMRNMPLDLDGVEVSRVGVELSRVGVGFLVPFHSGTARVTLS